MVGQYFKVIGEVWVQIKELGEGMEEAVISNKYVARITSWCDLLLTQKRRQQQHLLFCHTF